MQVTLSAAELQLLLKGLAILLYQGETPEQRRAAATLYLKLESTG